MAIIEPFNPWEGKTCAGSAKTLADKNGFQLQQWPVKLWKIPPTAPYFHGAHLLILADCASLAYQNLSQTLVGRLPLLCCPESDFDVSLKLRDILECNDIKSITVVRMDSPCCADLTDMVMQAVRQAKKNIHIRTTTVFIECEIVD